MVSVDCDNFDKRLLFGRRRDQEDRKPRTNIEDANQREVQAILQETPPKPSFKKRRKVVSQLKSIKISTIQQCWSVDLYLDPCYLLQRHVYVCLFDCFCCLTHVICLCYLFQVAFISIPNFAS